MQVAPRLNTNEVPGEAGEQLRLFIAVSAPEAVKDHIARAAAELRRVLPESAMRWTRREQLHLTLRFLGKVETPSLGALTQALRTTCATFAPLQMSAGGIGFFPQGRPPRVVWVGVRDQAGELSALQRAIQNVTAPFTAEPPEARFTGHITLGRVKHLRRPEAAALSQLAAGMAERRFGEWLAAEVELFRSQLSEQGALHLRLAAVPLAQKSP